MRNSLYGISFAKLPMTADNNFQLPEDNLPTQLLGRNLLEMNSLAPEVVFALPVLQRTIELTLTPSI